MPRGIVSAKGAVLVDEQGNELIDGIASWYTAMYGHCNPAIVQAVSEQLHRLDQIVFTGFTHEPAVKLAEKLLEILPENQARIFFNDNGSTAVEAAIKMALQYFYNQGQKRNTLIAFEDGFHGDTFGAMSVSGLSVYNGPFEEHFLKVERIPVPTDDNLNQVMAQLEAILRQKSCAAFIFEPLVQGAAGMKFHSAAGLDRLIGLCKEQQVLCIADEVMTGFGKTGRYFASDHLLNKPDIICLSKALTAGMMPMGITSCTREVYEAFLDKEVAKGFFHAHTYSANPPACAAAIAGIELLTSNDIKQQIDRINSQHKAFAAKLAGHPMVGETRVLGVIFVLELNIKMHRYGDLRNRLYQFYLEQGAFLRPLGNTVYILPPYVTTNAQLGVLYTAIEASLKFIEAGGQALS
jgi:adenosylmethionine-8-amino-7-oxononanoate aminotransferase